MAPLRIGLILPNRGVVIGATTVDEMLRLAAAAESESWDSVWVGDSLLAKPRLDAITLLSALAVKTTRVRIGVACMASTPLRDPLLLAYQWASLDLISGGRTIFVACQGGGPGSGEFEAELAAFGLDRRSRSRRLEEAIEIMRLTASGTPVSFDGEYRRFHDVAVLPRPVQRPVPIWIAANPDLAKPNNVATAYRRVARLADGWQTTHTTPENVARSIGLIKGFADDIGRELPRDFEVSVCSNICVDPEPEVAWAEAERFLNAHSATRHSRELLERWVAAGPPEHCVEYLRRFVDAGATSILLRLSSFHQERQFRLVTEKVLPALQ